MNLFNKYLEMVSNNSPLRDPVDLANKIRKYENKINDYFPWDKLKDRRDKGLAYERCWGLLEEILNIKVYPENVHLENNFEKLTKAVLAELTGLSTF